MPSTSFDTAHQDSLCMLIGKVMPGAAAKPIAAAVSFCYITTHLHLYKTLPLHIELLHNDMAA